MKQYQNKTGYKHTKALCYPVKYVSDNLYKKNAFKKAYFKF